MSTLELMNMNVKHNLVEFIDELDFTEYTDTELTGLKNWLYDVKKQADFFTLEDEVVGYAYNNISVLSRKINTEQVKRNRNMLVKTM